MKRWFLRNVRRLAMGLGVRPCCFRIRVRLSGTRRVPRLDVLSCGGVATWWATDEDVRAELARAWRVVCTKLRRRGVYVRLKSPVKLERGRWRFGFGGAP